MISRMANAFTLADGAEQWARARGIAVPRRGTPAWAALFSLWQRSGMSSGAARANPDALVTHLYAAEALAALLRSWGWHAAVLRRANGWTVQTNAHATHVTEAVRRTGIALETLTATAQAPRTPNRAPDREFSGRESELGALVSEKTKPVLQILEQGFGGGRAFTRDQLAQEAAALRGAHGQHLSPASVAIRAGHALAELERKGYVERVGQDLNAKGRPGAMKWTLTRTGEDRAAAQQDVDAFAFGENVVEGQIARLESQAAPPARAPLSGKTYRPSLPVLETAGHKLPRLQKARIRSAGYRTCNPPRHANPDEDMRALEWAARSGDTFAIAKLERMKGRLTGTEAPPEMQRVSSAPGARVSLPVQDGDLWLSRGGDSSTVFIYQARGFKTDARGTSRPNMVQVGTSSTFMGKRYVRLDTGTGERTGVDAPEMTHVRLWREGYEAQAAQIVAKYLAPVLGPGARVHLATWMGEHFSLAPSIAAPVGKIKLTTQRAPKKPAEAGSTDWTVEQIRAGLKTRSGKAWSVTRGRGTAYSWINVTSPKNRLSPTGYMTDAEAAELGRLFGLPRAVHHQGESIPGGSDFHQEFVDRAWGRTPTRYGVAHWMENPAQRAALVTCRVCGSLDHATQMQAGVCHFCREIHGQQMPAALYTPNPLSDDEARRIVSGSIGRYLVRARTDKSRTRRSESLARADELLSVVGDYGQQVFGPGGGAPQTHLQNSYEAAVSLYALTKNAAREKRIPTDEEIKAQVWDDYSRRSDLISDAERARRSSNAPRSKKCQLGYHDFEPATGLCRRSGCDAFHHAGQGGLFGRDLDPTAVRETLAREAATGQRDMFGRIVNPLTNREAAALLERESAARRRAGEHLRAGRFEIADWNFGDAHGLSSAVNATARSAGMRGRAFSRSERAWDGAAAVARRERNPLSVLVLNAPAPVDVRGGGSPHAGQIAAPNAPRGSRASNPPPGTLGLAEVRAHCKTFHGAPVARWTYVDVDDGKPGVTNHAVTALGLTEATVYSAPWRASNKHKAGVYEHIHEGRKPIEVYDPIGHVTVKLLENGSGPSDWWRDDRDPRRQTRRTSSNPRRRSA